MTTWRLRMITVVDELLRREAMRFGLRFGCEDCIAFDADRGRCAHEYPNAQHARVELARVHELVFCKEFEVT